jgi:putative tryptophan/tyrosine transport system substrate-binding protein
VKRREFITLLGGAAVGWPLVARAQQGAMPVVGWLSLISPNAAIYLPDFKKGLAEHGYVEGRNVVIEYRWAHWHAERLPALAADLVGRRVSVIVSGSNLPTALVAKAATATIPTVFFISEDPVQEGLVASLGRPGGNITGVTAMTTELTMKLVELMHGLRSSGVIGVLVNPRNGGGVFEDAARSAAQRLGQDIVVGNASNDSDFETAFNAVLQQQAIGLVITADPLFATRHEQLAFLAARHALPTVCGYGELGAGCLISYGPHLPDMFRKLGVYTGKILAGAKPADLPVEQPTHIPLRIDLKTAKALGLEVPPTLLVRADEVIE